jgi:hypothetical protein
MQTLPPSPDQEQHPLAHRRPEALDLAAGGLLVVTVVLHVAAMFPAYYSGGTALTASADQVAEYALLAAAWAVALGFGLAGPHRTPVAAGLAAGTAVTEFGFRFFDVGYVLRYGSGEGGPGLWLMTAAWVVGAAAAVFAVMAAVRRHGPQRPAASPRVVEVPAVDWAAPAVRPDDPTETGIGADDTATLPLADPTRVWPDASDPAAGRRPPAEDRHEQLTWAVLVAALAVATAGAFLPAWDHVAFTSSATGATRLLDESWAFDGPWQQVLGTVLSAVALLAVPLFALRIKNKAAGAGAVAGSLLVLTSQFLSAVVLVGSTRTYSAGNNTFEIEHVLGLTGWFTVDALCAYALFAAVTIWASLRPDPDGRT